MLRVTRSKMCRWRRWEDHNDMYYVRLLKQAESMVHIITVHAAYLNKRQLCSL